MTNYLICEKRKGKRISEEVCRKKCQDKCAAFQKLNTPDRGEDVEKEEVEPNSPQVKEGDETDVRYVMTIEAPSAVPSESKAQQLFQQVLTLKTEIEVRWFELGKILQEIFEHKYYRDLGYGAWKDFCEVALGPLELRWRTADYLRTNVMKCKEVGIGREIAGEIGWTKLKEIAPIITKENKDHWIEVARNEKMTVQMLWGKVQVALGKKTEKEIEILPEKMFFPLFPEQKKIVELALEVATRVDGSDKKGHLLADVIAPSFLAEYPPEFEAGIKAKMVVKLLERFEAAFKVKFIGDVVDETGEILVEGGRGNGSNKTL